MSDVALSPRERACQAQKQLIVNEKIAANCGVQRNPGGWHTIKVEVVTDGRTLVLLGEPPEDDPLDDDHHCDSMGCRWVHILSRIALTMEHQRQLSHLMPKDNDE